MIYIRTDANEKIATGHIMRCISIANSIIECGKKVIFIFRDVGSVSFLPNNIEYIMLDCLENELTQMQAILEATSNNKLLLDLYEFGCEYMYRLKPYSKIITFDDMFVEKLPADIIINYNIYFDKFDYIGRYGQTDTKLLLGSKYVPLREAFSDQMTQIRNKVETILLICGGGDKYHVLMRIVDRICKLELNHKYKFVVVAGALNKDVAALKRYEDGYNGIKIYKNVIDMVTLMTSCDIVVSAASTVLYESCALRIPTIFFTMADNQMDDVKAFSEHNMMLYIGDVRCNMQKVLENLVEQIEFVSNDIEVRKCMIDHMQMIVDGKGARRIAEEIIMLE